MKGNTSLLGKLLSCALLLALFCCSACEEDPAFLLASQKTRIDTVASNQIKLLKPQLDSICSERFDQMVLQAKDSIMRVRKEEIQKILNR